ncbi:hypothetical protein G9P44_000146 [Scheffersomyces stipitis]|nr:hypothetical protein G9P44_000146 [Scheffersomyces stipitis]
MKVFLSVALLAWLQLVIAEGFVKLPVQIKKGAREIAKSLSTLAPREATNNIVELDKTSGGYYVVNITVGTPPVPIAVELDTNLSDLWVLSPNSLACYNDACAQYGTFSIDGSSTWQTNNTAFNYQLVDDQADYHNIYGQDTIDFGNGLVLENATFAVANQSGSVIGTLGLSFENKEAATVKYANIPTLMKQRGYVKKSAYSLYVTDDAADAGSILFGGIDHAKYKGDLVSFDIVPENGDYNDLQINLTSVKICINDSCSEGPGPSSSSSKLISPTKLSSLELSSTKLSSSSTYGAVDTTDLSSADQTGSGSRISSSSITLPSSKGSSSVVSSSTLVPSTITGRQTVTGSATYVVSTLSTAYVSYYTEVIETSYYTVTGSTSKTTVYYTKTLASPKISSSRAASANVAYTKPAGTNSANTDSTVASNNNSSSEAWIDFYNTALKLLNTLQQLIQTLSSMYNQLSQEQNSSNNKKRQILEQVMNLKRDENEVPIGVPYNFDTSSDVTLFRSDIFQDILSILGPGEDLQFDWTFGAYKVPCYLLESNNSMIFNFDGKKEIQVPLSTFIFSKDTDEGVQCGLKISTTAPSSFDQGTFGVDFMRHAYIVFNLDDKTISLADVDYSEDEQISVIE